MEPEYLDLKKKGKILADAGPALLEHLGASNILNAYLVKAGLITFIEGEDMEKQSPSKQRSTILNLLHRVSVLKFIYFCLIVHDWCYQPHIITDIFNLDVEQLRLQKEQLETRDGTAKDHFPPTKQPEHRDGTAAFGPYYTVPPSLPDRQPVLCLPPNLGTYGSMVPYTGLYPPRPDQQPRQIVYDNRGSFPIGPDYGGGTVRGLPALMPRQGPHDSTTTKITKKSGKKVHYCSFIVEEQFEAGDGNLQSPQYNAFVAKITRGVRNTLQEYTSRLLTVLALCVSQLKRMVLIKIQCDEGLTEGEIQEALLSPNNELNKACLHVCPGTILFRDEIPAMVILDILTKRHMHDSLGRRIDFNTQYIYLKILITKSLSALKRDDLERPDKYQRILQRDGRDIKDEDLIAPGEVVKYVLVRGRAGIGKSTIVQRLLWRWAHGEWARHFKVIFLLNVRHLMAMVTSVDLPHLLSRFAAYKVGLPQAALDPEWLQQNQCQVAVVTDGVDEVLRFKEEWEKAHTNMSLTMEAPALTWVFGLLRRRCLQQSTLIVTSRPFADLSCIEPTMHVEVIGLTRDHVIEFVEKNVDLQHVDRVKETLVSQPILLSVSSITFYCAALCQVLQNEIGVTEQLSTYTQITAYIMERYIRHSFKSMEGDSRKDPSSLPDNNPKKSSSLQALMRLAYDGMLKSRDGGLRQLYFDEEDLARQNITSEHVETARQSGMFVQTEVPNAHTNKKQVIGEFVHLSVQEFFSIIGLLFQTPTQVKEGLKMLSSGHFDMALLCLYGFAFNSNSEPIKRLCATFGVSCDVGEDIRALLKKHIKTGRSTLQVLQMVHETQSVEVAQLVGQSKRFRNEVKISRAEMMVVDILALIFFLKNNAAITSVVLELVVLDVVSVRELAKFIKYNKTIKSLKLDTGLDGQCLSLLTDALCTNKTCTVQQLDLGITLVRSEGARALLQTLTVNETLTVQIGEARCSADLMEQLEAHSRIKVRILRLEEPSEFQNLSSEHVEADRAAWAAVAKTVSPCHVMEGAGKTSEQGNRDFNPYHDITNAMEAEMTKNWWEYSDVPPVCLQKKEAASLFTHEHGGTLRMPGSDVILWVPPKAVPEGQMYLIYGAVHLDLKEYNHWMSSENEHIVAPVPEYRVEGRHRFDRPVVITIPHCVPPHKTTNIRVLCVDGKSCTVLQVNGQDTSYTVHHNDVTIHTHHFTRFLVTSSGGKEEDITDALLTVAASKHELRNASTYQVRVMLHSGCLGLHDFCLARNQYNDDVMKEIDRLPVRLPELEDAIAFPTIDVNLRVHKSCDAEIEDGDTPKEKTTKVNGRDALRLPKRGIPHRSVPLENFLLRSEQHMELDCTLTVKFIYQEPIEPVVNRLPVQYPMALTRIPERENRDESAPKWMTGNTLTQKEVADLITKNRAAIYDRMSTSYTLIAHLQCRKVIGPAEMNELDADGQTENGRIKIILDAIVHRGVEAFLNFCLILGLDDIEQSHIVTDVMGLDMHFIESQYGKHYSNLSGVSNPMACVDIPVSNTGPQCTTDVSIPAIAQPGAAGFDDEPSTSSAHYDESQQKHPKRRKI